ncbi:glycoside hydrolase family 88 protein [Paenibacillus algorifonticola]|uniref:glycoside hydrolase family 88/105 protein n=1 Tax=Paenibacillus algorifonticola TaxID=684063 RepID=UPI003D2DC48D
MSLSNLAETMRVRDALALEWGVAACDSLMARFPEAHDLPPANRWHYHQGVFLYGMLKVWEQNGDERYLLYIKSYADALIDPYGNLTFERGELDGIMAGLILFTLDEQFDDPRYRLAADRLLGMFGTLNQTSEGGYWHKDKYPYQMWLDGLYMGGVFAMIYGAKYEKPELLDMALKQERLMNRRMKDTRTGLLYHAWDETRSMPWANPETGCSPEFWGRSLGWYGLALVDFLDVLPTAHPGRATIELEVAALVEALTEFQDDKSGLWYQVVNKGEREDNWLETSCTCLFLYTIAKAIKHGCISKAYSEIAVKGYEGLLRTLHSDETGLIVTGICIGTSAGDYRNYVTRPTSENDLHGVGAFVLACVELDGVLSLQPAQAGEQ